MAGEEEAYRRRGPVPFTRLAQGPGNLGQALNFQLSDNHAPIGGPNCQLKEPAERPDWVSGPRIRISKNAAAPCVSGSPVTPL
ncbi:3-methyladenine DNA glycosylase [Corynebacterium faecale]|nr:3-methyladenine DNA glycosylase [Corynebacterium faecale]